VALDCAKQYNSAIVVVKQKCNNVPAADAPNGTPCPTWFLHDSSANGTCRCGDDVHGVVICNDSTKEVAILNHYCMTYSESTGPVAGSCFYYSHTLGVAYRPLPSNITELDMCGYYNRAGQLCGECKENYSIPVYSYGSKCVQCSMGHFGWVVYIVAAFLPLTVFFILVLSCRLSATSPRLSAFAFVSQAIALGANVRNVLAAIEPYPIAEMSAKVIFSIYGIWNLDFFRTPSINTQHTVLCCNNGTITITHLTKAANQREVNRGSG